MTFWEELFGNFLLAATTASVVLLATFVFGVVIFAWVPKSSAPWIFGITFALAFTTFICLTIFYRRKSYSITNAGS